MTSGEGSPRIVVIGAGFGGLGTAMELVRHGFTDVTVLEKADDIGCVIAHRIPVLGFGRASSSPKIGSNYTVSLRQPFVEQTPELVGVCG